MMTLALEEKLALKINGAVLTIAERPALKELDAPLRGIALSDSPVLIQGTTEDCDQLVNKLHSLGRRAALPVRTCYSPDEAEVLFDAILADGDTQTGVLGTWALHGVDSWPRELQMSLNRVLEAFDEGRLHGRLRHERIPRVVVLQQREARKGALEPELQRRLSFFHLTAGPHERGQQ